MDDHQELDRLVENIEWFNEFFSDLRTLFEKIGERARKKFALGPGHSYRYYKSDHVVRIPDYYMVGIGGNAFALQIFAVLRPDVLSSQPLFRPESSIVVLAHSHGQHPGHLKDYGERLMANDRVRVEGTEIGVLHGSLRKDEDLPFVAIQLDYDEFVTGKALDDILKTRVFPHLEAYERRIMDSAAASVRPDAATLQ